MFLLAFVAESIFCCEVWDSDQTCQTSLLGSDIAFHPLTSIAKWWCSFMTGVTVALQCQVNFCSPTKWISVYVHRPPPSWTSLTPPLSHPSRSPENIELNSLGYPWGSHSLSVWPMVVYICQSQSPNSSHLLFPPHPMSTSLFSASVSLLRPCKHIFLVIFSKEANNSQEQGHLSVHSIVLVSLHHSWNWKEKFTQ